MHCLSGNSTCLDEVQTFELRHLKAESTPELSLIRPLQMDDFEVSSLEQLR